MTEQIRAWEDPLFYIRSDDPDAYAQIVKLQRIGKHVRALSDAATVDTNGDVLQDVLKGQSLGNLTQRHRYRALYDSTNDRYVIQRNSGTDASKTWVELLRIEASGSMTGAGGGSFDTLTATDGGLTVSGDIDVNGYYIRNLDKVVGLLRTDSLRVHQTTTFDDAVTFNGVTLFYQSAIKALAFKDQVRNAQVASDAAISRSKIAAGSTNRLVYNAASTGLLADASAITAARALISDSNGVPTHSSVTSTELALLSGRTTLGSLTLLATYTPSAVASVDVTSVISATYDRYFVAFSLRPATDDVELWARSDVSNGASFDTAGYQWSSWTFDSVSLLHVDYSSSSSSRVFISGAPAATASVGNAVGEYVEGSLWVDVTTNSFRCDSNWRAAAGGFGRASSSGVATTGSINAFQLLFESGNITSGTVYVFGLSKT